MKKTAFTLTIVAILILNSLVTFAQEWTKEQKEVWQVVVDSWEKYANNDFDEFFSYLHEKYQGWNHQDPLPSDIKAVRKQIDFMKDNSKVTYYNINPARIAVKDNSAVVDYYFVLSYKYTMGEKSGERNMQGKNAEFWIKEKGKWLLLGDMTFFKEVGSGESEEDD